jgi:hypothetical protein
MSLNVTRCAQHTDSNGQRCPQRHPCIVHAQRQAADAQKPIATLQLIRMSRRIDYLTVESDCNIFTGPKVISRLFLTERLFSNIVLCHLVRLGLPLLQIATVRHVAAREPVELVRSKGTWGGYIKLGRAGSTSQAHDPVDILDIHCDFSRLAYQSDAPAVFGWVDMKIGVVAGPGLSLRRG